MQFDPPDDLAVDGRGRAFWGAITEENDLAPAEAPLLAEACRLLDELDALREVVAEHGTTTIGSRSQFRINPAFAEMRQSRSELRRLLEALAIPPEAAEGDVGSLTSRRAQHAARTRWAGRGARSSADA